MVVRRGAVVPSVDRWPAEGGGGRRHGHVLGSFIAARLRRVDAVAPAAQVDGDHRGRDVSDLVIAEPLLPSALQQRVAPPHLQLLDDHVGSDADVGIGHEDLQAK